MAEPVVSLPKAVQGLTLKVKVTGQRELALRLRLGIALIRLAGWIFGTRTEIELSLGEVRKAPATPSLAIPPSHLSVEELDRPGSISWLDANRIMVMVDGVEVRDVVAYDVEDGWVECHARGPDGTVVVEDGELKLDRRTGLVTVSFRD